MIEYADVQCIGYFQFERIIFLFEVVQEAVGTGDPELLQMVLERRDYQRYTNRVAGIPELLHKLKQVSCRFVAKHYISKKNYPAALPRIT